MTIDRLIADPDLRSDPAAQAELVRELERRGDRARIIDLVMADRVEAMLRTATGASIHFRNEAILCGPHSPVLDLACGALSIKCEWGSDARRRYCCDTALRVTGLIKDEALREAWREHLAWWRAGCPMPDRGDPMYPAHPAPEDSAPSAPSHVSDDRARAACFYTVSRSPRYAVEAVSRAAVEAVSLFAGHHTRATEERWQTRRILETMLGVK